jgi:hypothetical protein
VEVRAIGTGMAVEVLAAMPTHPRRDHDDRLTTPAAGIELDRELLNRVCGGEGEPPSGDNSQSGTQSVRRPIHY